MPAIANIVKHSYQFLYYKVLKNTYCNSGNRTCNLFHLGKVEVNLLIIQKKISRLFLILKSRKSSKLRNSFSHLYIFESLFFRLEKI